MDVFVCQIKIYWCQIIAITWDLDFIFANNLITWIQRDYIFRMCLVSVYISLSLPSQRVVLWNARKRRVIHRVYSHSVFVFVSVGSVNAKLRSFRPCGTLVKLVFSIFNLEFWPNYFCFDHYRSNWMIVKYS